MYIENGEYMDFNDIKNKTLIISNDYIKEDYLLNNKKLSNIKFMNKIEFIKKITFDYSEESIYFIMNKYNVKYSVAVIYLNNLRYINKSYNETKLNFLFNLKKELIDNNLLIIDDLFIKYIQTINVIIYNIELSKEEEELFKNFKIINTNYKNNIISNVYEFSNMELEIEFVCLSILNLIDKGINIESIGIINYSDEYYNTVTDLFNKFNIKINLKNISNLYANPYVINFINKLKENNNITESLSIIEDEEIYNEVVLICNKWNFKKVDNIIIDCLINEFKNTKLKNIKYSNSVSLYNIDDVLDNKHIFLIGFNDSSMPKIYKDEDYLNDDLKTILNIETSYQKNIRKKEYIINNLKNIDNLTISYKLRSNTDQYFKSSLVDYLNLNIIKNYEFSNKYNYSNIYNKISLSKMKDKLNKYNEIDSNLNKLSYNYKDINYMTYNNAYEGIDKNNLYSYINNKLLLSYTSLEEYYKCGFKYYLKYILKIDKYEDNLSAKIGRVMHKVLSMYKDDSFDFDKCYEDCVLEEVKNKKEQLIFKKLKQELLFIIDGIKKQEETSTFNKELHEEKIYINKKYNLDITFMGIIDKIKYEEDKSLLAVIDYKTGSIEIDLNKLPYGLGMQLPIYMYLIKNSEQFKDYKIVGLYLQKILNNDISYDPLKDYTDEKYKLLKLEGYSTNNQDDLYLLDCEFDNSNIIKGMGLKNDGEFRSTAKTLSNEEIDKIIEITSNKIEEAINNIEEAKFDINPKRMIDEELSCEFCKFSDVCFKTEKDIIDLKKYKDLEFLK